MKTICTLRSFLRLNAVHYYTIQRDDRNETEAEDFFSRMEGVQYDGVDYTDEVDKFTDFIYEIGDWRGARTEYFREEDRAVALPPKRGMMRKLGREEMQVRLYCYRITERLVILFNGDIKTPGPLKAQQCPRVRPYFEQAKRLAKGLDKGRTDNSWWPTGYEIEFDGKELTFEVQL